MKRLILLLLASGFCYGTLFGVDAQVVTNKRRVIGRQAVKQEGPTTSKISRPAPLGAGLMVLPTVDLQRANRRVGKLEKSYIDTLTPVLRDAVGGRYDTSACYTALILFVPLADDFWENDQFKPAMLERYVKRLKGLPSEEVSTWQQELNNICEQAGGDASQMETVGYLIQLGRLFSAEDEFKKNESEAMLARLRSLSSKALETCKSSIDSYTSQAAIMLIQDNLLFKQNRFQEQAFDRALQRLKAGSPSSPKKGP